MLYFVFVLSMFPSTSRLTSKDVRYIQKIRKIAFSKNFRIQRVPQYPNRKFHQISIYIAANKIHRSSWRHYFKRRLLEKTKIHLKKIPGGIKYYKVFISLNPKTVDIDLRRKPIQERKLWMENMCNSFQQEIPSLWRRLV